MRLKVNGIEEIEITDPNKLCGHRKKLDKNLLQSIKGLDFTAKQLKQMFGYGETTALADTQLAHLVEAVEKQKAPKHPSYTSRAEEKATRWRVL